MCSSDLPPQEDAQAKCQALIERVIVDEGLILLGWRDVPTDPSKLGRDARAVCPKIRQVFIGRGTGMGYPVEIERKLYVVRKIIEHSLADCGITEDEADYFYICSMSCHTIVYKGLLMAVQIEGFYLDLADERVESAFALVHSRFSTNTLGHWKLAHPYR